MDQELRQYLDAKLTTAQNHLVEALTRMMTDMETRIGERMEETMRNRQTELLRSLAASYGSIMLRLQIVESDQSNLDAALSRRVDFLETQLGRSSSIDLEG